METFFQDLSVDTRVEAKWDGSWYPGSIFNIFRSSTGIISGARVHFDDGDEREYAESDIEGCLRPQNMRRGNLSKTFSYDSVQLYGSIDFSSSCPIDFSHGLSGMENHSIVPRSNAEPIQTLLISFDRCMIAPKIERIELCATSLHSVEMYTQLQTVQEPGCVVPDNDAKGTKLQIAKNNQERWDVNGLSGKSVTSMIIVFRNNTQRKGDVRLKLFMRPIEMGETMMVPLHAFSSKVSQFSFTSLFEDEECDLRIKSKVDGKCVRAHRIILSKIPYFKSLLEWPSGQKPPDSVDGIRTVGIDAPGDILRLVVRYAYGFRVADDIPIRTCIRLIDYAKLYVLPDLLYQVTLWLRKNVTPKVIGVFLRETKESIVTERIPPVVVHALAQKGWSVVSKNIDQLHCHPELLKKLVRRIDANEAYRKRMKA